MKAHRIEDAPEALVAGRMVVVVDNENCENEGDLILAAEHATTESVAFMVRHSSGVICVGLPGERLDELALPLMVVSSTESMGTAYTISVDYCHGTSSGISAADRRRHVARIGGPSRDRGRLQPPWPHVSAACTTGWRA